MIKLVKLSIFTIFLSSCSFLGSNKETTEKNDSLKLSLLNEILSIRQELDTVYEADSVIKKELEIKRSIIDTLRENSIKFKDNTLELLAIKEKLNVIKCENKKLICKNDSIRKSYKKMYEEIFGENEKIKTELMNTKKRLISIEDSFENSKKKAAILNYNSFQVVGIGISGNKLFGTLKEYQTDKANKIKLLKICLTIPENNFAKKEDKHIVVKIYSINKNTFLQKDTTVRYSGSEINLSLKVKEENLAGGNHTAELFVNGLLEKTTNLSVKN